MTHTAAGTPAANQPEPQRAPVGGARVGMSMALHTAVLLTGGNLGDVAATIARARSEVERRVGAVTAASGVYSSPPWGFEEGEEVPDFLNQVLVVQTELEPLELLDRVQAIEEQLGRRRDGVPGEASSATVRRTALALRLLPPCADRHHATRDEPAPVGEFAVLGSPRSASSARFTESTAPRPYNSRTMDIDILYYDDLVMESQRLTIPHPLIAEREFVLRPLCELMPEWRDPRTDKTVAQMLSEL